MDFISNLLGVPVEVVAAVITIISFLLGRKSNGIKK